MPTILPTVLVASPRTGSETLIRSQSDAVAYVREHLRGTT